MRQRGGSVEEDDSGNDSLIFSLGNFGISYMNIVKAVIKETFSKNSTEQGRGINPPAEILRDEPQPN